MAVQVASCEGQLREQWELKFSLCSTCQSVVPQRGTFFLIFTLWANSDPGYCRGWSFYTMFRGFRDPAPKVWDQHPKQVSLWIAIDFGISALWMCGSTLDESPWLLVLRSLETSPKETSWPLVRWTMYSRMVGIDRTTVIKSQKGFTLSEYCIME